MPTSYARSEEFKTPDCRISFAQNLFKAREMQASGTKKFGCTLIFANEMMTAKTCHVGQAGERKQMSLQDIVANVIVETWGEKGLVRAKDGLIKSPFLPGNGPQARSKKTGELHAGMGDDVFFIRTNANEDRPPKVFGTVDAQVPASQEDVYSGCYGFAILNAYTWNNPQNGDGVSFGVNMFFKRSDGDRLGGGGSSPDEWAETVDDAGDAPEETKAGAGAGGLFG